MDEVVKMVVEKAGIPEDKARMAVQVVAGYLKDKVPGPMAAQVESALTGTGGAAAGLGSVLGGKLGL